MSPQCHQQTGCDGTEASRGSVTGFSLREGAKVGSSTSLSGSRLTKGDDICRFCPVLRAICCGFSGPIGAKQMEGASRSWPGAHWTCSSGLTGGPSHPPAPPGPTGTHVHRGDHYENAFLRQVTSQPLTREATPPLLPRGGVNTDSRTFLLRLRPTPQRF